MPATAETRSPGTEAPEGPPAQAGGVELLGRLSGSGYRQSPGLVRRGDGQTLQVTPLLYDLLSLLDGRRDAAALSQELAACTGTLCEPDDVAFLLDKLRPLGLLARADGTTPSVQKANPLLALKLKFVITNPRVTRRITAPFAWLFHPLVVLPTVAAFLLTCWWVLFDRGLASAAHEAIYQPGLLLTVFGLTLASAAFHEFGHAAACRYGGATPGAMGGGLYLVWPAFYTDVDDSYRLGRGGRLRVDLGGLYFNALFAVGMAGVAWMTGKDAYLLVVVTQLLQMLRQLAPFMRADGYHILADLTGVPDLFSHIKPTLLGLWPSNWGRPEGRVLKPWARYVVTLWVLVIVPVLLGLLVLAVWLLPRLAATAWHSAGLHASAMTGALGDGDVAAAAVRVLSLVALVLPVLAITYLLVRVVRRTSRSVWRSTEGRPRARAAALLGAAVLVALVGWAWWPNGQYTPVDGTERGTLPSIVLPAHDVPTLSLPAVAVGGEAQLRLPEVRARAAIALVPRLPEGADRSSYPTVLLTGGQQTGQAGQTAQPVEAILTGAEPGAHPEQGRTFPFLPPPTPSEGDNQAIAIGDTDGGVVYDVSYALVWVTEGDAVDHRNEAWALASCTDCTTVAVAFQVILVIGQSDSIIPINTAVAANYECTDCVTHAVAVQLVATLNGVPSPEVEHELALAWAMLDDLTASIEELSVEQIYAALLAVERAILQVLTAEGPVDATSSTVTADGEVEGADPTTSPSASSTPDDTSTDGTEAVEPTATPTSTTAEPTPTSSTTTSPSPSPSPTAEDVEATPTQDSTSSADPPAEDPAAEDPVEEMSVPEPTP